MDKKTAIKKFNDIINEFYSARLIIVERTISKLLSLIVSQQTLYEVVEQAAKSCSYEHEYNKAVTQDDIGAYITMPDGNRQTIIFVVGLLYDFDNKTMPIVEFVTKYFPSETPHQSYIAFCDTIITPFARAYKHVLEGDGKVFSEVLQQEMAIIPFADKAKEDADFWLRSLLDVVIGDNATTESARREYITMINGLLYVLETRNPMLIKVVWIGLKNTMADHKAGFRELNEIETIFKSYGVID